MARANVILSTARWEGLPLATIEAMVLRRPIVAWSCPGMSECIENGRDGLLVPIGDIEGTASTLLRVLGAPDIAKALGSQARKTAEARFSNTAYALAFTKVI